MDFDIAPTRGLLIFLQIILLKKQPMKPHVQPILHVLCLERMNFREIVYDFIEYIYIYIYRSTKLFLQSNRALGRWCSASYNLTSA